MLIELWKSFHRWYKVWSKIQSPVLFPEQACIHPLNGPVVHGGQDPQHVGFTGTVGEVTAKRDHQLLFKHSLEVWIQMYNPHDPHLMYLKNSSDAYHSASKPGHIFTAKGISEHLSQPEALLDLPSLNGSIHHLLHSEPNTCQQDPKPHAAYGTSWESVRLGVSSPPSREVAAWESLPLPLPVHAVCQSSPVGDQLGHLPIAETIPECPAVLWKIPRLLPWEGLMLLLWHRPSHLQWSCITVVAVQTWPRVNSRWGGPVACQGCTMATTCYEAALVGAAAGIRFCRWPKLWVCAASLGSVPCCA